MNFEEKYEQLLSMMNTMFKDIDFENKNSIIDSIVLNSLELLDDNRDISELTLLTAICKTTIERQIENEN